MHESMVAQKLLAAIAQESETRNLKPISAKISCGKFYAINDEILNFAFEAITKGTKCQDVKLNVEHKPLRAECKNCNTTFDLDIDLLCCSKCNTDDIKILPDPPLLLEQIEFEDNENE